MFNFPQDFNDKEPKNAAGRPRTRDIQPLPKPPFDVDFYFNFSSTASYDFISPYSFTINETEISNTMSVHIDLNGSTYSIGATISQFDTLTITPNINGLLIIKGYKI
jgi:hypothetical protein